MCSIRKVYTMNTHKLIRTCLYQRAPDFHTSQNYPTRCLQYNMTSLMSTITQVAKGTALLYDVLPTVVNTLVRNPKLLHIPEMSNFLQKLIEYNVTGGKKSRGLAVVSAYETIEKPTNITPESLMKARTLGWILEMNHAYFIIVDDMMDDSSTRRGKPCWHELAHIGRRAANDAELLKFSIYESFKTHFKNEPLYYDMVDLLNETLIYSTMGQHLDFTMAHRIKSDYSLFTIERYNSIVKYKTAYYTFKLPVLLGYLLANNSDKELHKKVEEVCLNLGILYQIQDDMLDCYADESLTGKKGTDIQEGKCTWFAVHALKLSNNAQRAFFIKNYSDKDPVKVKNIKYLYQELKLDELYKNEEKVLYEGIQTKAKVLPSNDKKLLLNLLNMYYKRIL